MASLAQDDFRDFDPVLASLADLLRRLDVPDKADWVELRRGILCDPAQPTVAKNEVVRELRGIIHGMGGLLDLNVVDKDMSGERDDLANRLYALTRPSTEASAG